MNLAIMQPYIFPYIGYFQLVYASEKFILYDDVNYIKQGWINRNRILVSGTPNYFTIPLKDASSFKAINETELANNYINWKLKFYKTLYMAYRNAPNFNSVMQIIKTVFDENYSSVAGLAAASITATSAYLELPTIFISSSGHYGNIHLKGAERVIDICKTEHATKYYNLPGGKNLYKSSSFAEHNILLEFIEPEIDNYNQFDYPFAGGLSIIDVMMFNSVSTIKTMLVSYLRN